MTGSERLYAFVDDNPRSRCAGGLHQRQRRHPPLPAHDRDQLRCRGQVDLTGQVCADSIGHQLLSGVGGDDPSPPRLAEEGRAIIALPSIAAGGTCSRIVATLRPGAGVVTTRAHVETVVTERRRRRGPTGRSISEPRPGADRPGRSVPSRELPEREARESLR
ncbi:MAG: acetyl-CoA hydrolase/transferase C-terminal domain-containing protein [Candidatus Binatia bacterium]